MSLPSNITPTLRTLTAKSVLWFGKHEGKSIQQMLDINETTYLRWIYYNIKGVSFIPEILDEIYVREPHRINKPGINPDLHQELTDALIASMGIKKQSHLKRRAKAKSIEQKVREKRTSISLAVLQSKNHGHTYKNY